MESPKKRGFYFSQIDKGGVGPRKKVCSQIEAFKKSGVELTLIESPFQTEGLIRGNFILRQIVSRLPFTYVYSRHKYEKFYSDADVFYVRFLAGDIFFSNFIKRLKKNNPNSKIVMELADYPTTWYMTTSLLYKVVYFPIILKDVFARHYYRKYVDRIAILKPIEQIYGIPTLKFENGIDVDNVSARKPSGIGKVKMIAVAAMCNFHGYDRLIEGINEYYTNGGRREVEIHFVGGKEAPGNELYRYKSLVEQYNLCDIVHFHGEKIGNELEEIYDTCNVAVGSLGMYRIGYQTANSLKIREYLAKGFPIITGCPTDVFEDSDFEYYCEFSNDATNIDIARVIDFFDIVYTEDESKVIETIRNFALKRCDMVSAMKPIIDYFME